MKSRTSTAGIALLALVSLAACSSSRSSGAPATTAGPATSSPATSTATPTSAPATTEPTTTAPAVDMMQLRQDGVGSAYLGDPAGDVVSALTAVLGAAESDVSADYPTPNGPDSYLDALGEIEFGATRGRTVCFPNSLCLFFGGPDDANLSFVGWSYTSDPAAAMHTISGVTIGSRWADFASMEVYEGGCYTVGSGVADGVRLWVQSTGDPFSGVDAAGNWMNYLPAPADVTVTALESGDMPLFLAGDC